MIDGEPWFAALDVITACGLSHAKGASGQVYSLHDHEKQTMTAQIFDHHSDWGSKHKHGGMLSSTKLLAISESGLCKLVTLSEKAQAKVFQNCVTEEALPSIRKTGKYSLAD
jgi:prophage antirepressor-like protein